MKRRLLLAAGILVVLDVVGTIVAIAQKLPYHHPLWGVGDPDHVLRDWLVGSGTALSAPALMLVVLIVAMFLLTRARPAYSIGVWAITLLAVGATIGVVGERITWDSVRPGTFDLFRAVQSWGSVATVLFLLVFGVMEILNLRRQKGESISITSRAGT